MTDELTLDGQTFKKGDVVILGCSCHTDERGKIESFTAGGQANIWLDSKERVCLPLHMLNRAE